MTTNHHYYFFLGLVVNFSSPIIVRGLQSLFEPIIRSGVCGLAQSYQHNMEPFSTDVSSLWKKQLQPIPDDLRESITNFSVLQFFDFSDNLHYVGFMFTTNNHQTYVYGEKICHLVRLPFKDGQPQLIQELNGKIISQVVFGYCHVAILTEDGLVYLYGLQGWKNKNPRYLVGKNDQRFKQIASGGSHLLLLTTDNQLMALGSNEFGQITGQFDSYCSLVHIDLKNVRKIDCGERHSLALCDDGRVFSWGSNEFGCLGLGHEQSTNRPQLIEYFQKSKNRIKDVVAYRSNSLFLSKDGSLYGCGSEQHWQLGSRYFRNDGFYPIPLTISAVETIAPVAWSHNFSMVFAKNKMYYVWGKLNNILIHGLNKTYRSVKSFSEASSLYLPVPLTFGWTPVAKPKIDYQKKLAKSIGNMFDNPSNHDFVFRFADDRKIFARRQYLQDVSEYLNKFLSEKMCPDNSVEIKYNSYDVFYQYIRLLHFGTIEIRVENLAELLDLAECFLDETLTGLCEEFMMKNLDPKNYQHYYQLAVGYRLENLRQKIQQEYVIPAESTN